MTTDEQLRDALEKWREGARQAQLRKIRMLCIFERKGSRL